jgi:hypothetical protein
VPLKEVVLWLKRGAKGPIFEGEIPLLKVTPKAGANIGAITEVLFRDKKFWWNLVILGGF